MKAPYKTTYLFSNIARRVLEAFFLFIVLPLVFYAELVDVPKLAALMGVSVYCLCRLWYDGTIHFVELNLNFLEEERWEKLLLRSMLVGIFILLLVVWIQPENLLSMPSESMVVWITVLVLYPLLSVLPQEIIYRKYFFHRLQDLFNSTKAFVFTNALVFAFLHIVYDNWWAIILSFFAGILFSITYMRTKSLFWVTVEHTLFGWLIFTLGLGNYFYEGF